MEKLEIIGLIHASTLSQWCYKSVIYSNHLNHETYSEPCFPAPQLYLLSHTLKSFELFGPLNVDVFDVQLSIKLYPHRSIFTLMTEDRGSRITNIVNWEQKRYKIVIDQAILPVRFVDVTATMIDAQDRALYHYKKTHITLIPLKSDTRTFNSLCADFLRPLDFRDCARPLEKLIKGTGYLLRDIYIHVLEKYQIFPAGVHSPLNIPPLDYRL